MHNIKFVSYPNTQPDSERSFFDVGKNCDEIITVYKNGEMVFIGWLQIIKEGKIVAEIKESVCDIYGEDVYNKPVDCGI
jgi:hypothetical protein